MDLVVLTAIQADGEQEPVILRHRLSNPSRQELRQTVRDQGVQVQALWRERRKAPHGT